MNQETFKEELNLFFTESPLTPSPVVCGDSERMDYPHKQTKTFSIFVTTHVLPREEINRRANTYQNFLNKDGTPKSKIRHKVEGKYTLSYHRNKIVDSNVKKKFEAIRKHLKHLHSSIQEEYTKKRLVYWDSSNRCLYTLEPRRKSLWLGINGKISLKGYRKYFDHNKTYFRIEGNTNIENILVSFIVQNPTFG